MSAIVRRTTLARNLQNGKTFPKLSSLTLWLLREKSATDRSLSRSLSALSLRDGDLKHGTGARDRRGGSWQFGGYAAAAAAINGVHPWASFKILCAMQTTAHSAATFSTPRNRH